MKPRMAEKLRRKREWHSSFVCPDCGCEFLTQAELSAHQDYEDYGIGCDDEDEEIDLDNYSDDVPLVLRTKRVEHAIRSGVQRGLDEFTR